MKSLFTKALVTTAAVCMGYTAFAQVNVTNDLLDKKYLGDEREISSFEMDQLTKQILHSHGKLEVDEWYNYNTAMYENGERFTYFVNSSIMPDSNCVQIFEDENGNKVTGHTYTHGIGQTFDPKSDLFLLTPTTPPLSRFNAYTVDSIAFFYKYFNANPGVVDTILVQFYHNSNLPILPWSNRTTGQRWNAATFRYDRAKNKGVADKEIKIPISESTENFYQTTFSSFTGVVELSPDLGETNANSPMGFSVQFIPGMSYSLGDTIVNDSLVQGDVKVNSFQPLYIRQGTVQAPAFLEDTSQNHAMHLYSFIRYDNTGNWTTWFPGNVVTTPARTHMWSVVKMRSNNVGVKELNFAGYGLGNAYPNPANSNDVVNIPFALGNSENVTIEMFDLVGKSIATVSGHFGAGDHVEAMSTNNLKPGIYLYTITAGDYSATKKFTIK